MTGWHAPDELLPLTEHNYVAQMREALKPTKVSTGAKDPGSFRSYYGDDGGEFPNWEDDPDSPYMYREDYYPHGNHYMPHKPKTLRPIRSRQRARRIETWTEGGQAVGRWFWEYRDTP